MKKKTINKKPHTWWGLIYILKNYVVGKSEAVL